MKTKLIKVADLPKDFPLKKETLYMWAHKKRYPELFVKIGGALLFDVDAWEKLIESSRIKPLQVEPRKSSRNG